MSGLSGRLRSLWEEHRSLLGYFMLRMMTIGLGFISTLLIMQRLSELNFGTFSLFSDTIDIAIIPAVGWVSTSIIYFGVRERERTGAMHATMAAWFTLSGAGTVLTALALWALSPVLDAQMHMQLTQWATVLVVLITVADLVFQCLIALSRQVLVAWVELAARIGSLLIIYTYGHSVDAMLWSMAALHGIKILAAVSMDWGLVFPLRWDSRLLKEILHFSLWQLFGLGVTLASQHLSSFIIRGALSLDDVSTYTAAQRLVAPMANLSHIFVVFYAPNVAKHMMNQNRVGLRQIYHRDRILLVVTVTLAHAALILLAPTIFRVLFADRYAQSIPVFQLMVPVSLLRYADVLITPYANAAGKFRQLQWINAGAGALILLLSFMLIRPMGVMGIVVAALIGAIAGSIALNVYFGRLIARTVNAAV